MDKRSDLTGERADRSERPHTPSVGHRTDAIGYRYRVIVYLGRS